MQGCLQLGLQVCYMGRIHACISLGTFQFFMKGFYLGSTYEVQGCADLCAQYGYRCTLFTW